MSGQLESRHFYRARDRVQHMDGRVGTVEEAWALYALIGWEDGRREEVEQFDSLVIVLQRAEAG